MTANYFYAELAMVQSQMTHFVDGVYLSSLCTILLSLYRCRLHFYLSLRYQEGSLWERQQTYKTYQSLNPFMRKKSQ